MSVGSGAGGLATAIVAVDDGQTVFVAQSRATGRGSPYRLGLEVSDSDTNTYLDAVTEVAGPPRPGVPGVDLPVRLLADAVPGGLRCNRRHDPVEPFVGARLGDWAAACVVAPHRLLYSHVTGRNMTTMRSSSGERFEAAVVGSLDAGRDEWVIDDWLSAQALDRGIDIHTDSSFERLVFDDGRVVGAVVRTPDGVCAVSARRGVVMTTGGPCAATAVETPVQVCVVSKTASRFGRVELLGRPCVTGSRLAPTQQNHQLRSHNLGSRARCHSTAPGQFHDGNL
ncbi:MAG: FAD-binding protein [Mycobacteriaceae bacterium]|nr:FAD-binding protein [Mycobacteriaceae bacterium]MBV9641303.1 FAD-binding protein [Mycobacteriaceae bacterium]